MERRITVYSTPFCAACEDLKQYLHDRGLPFTVRDVLVDEAAAEELEAHGIYTTPALRVDGERIAALLG